MCHVSLELLDYKKYRQKEISKKRINSTLRLRNDDKKKNFRKINKQRKN